MATFQPDPYDQLELGLAGHITTERWLKTACALAAVLGAAITLAAELAAARWHLNRTARRHRP